MATIIDKYIFKTKQWFSQRARREKTPDLKLRKKGERKTKENTKKFFGKIPRRTTQS